MSGLNYKHLRYFWAVATNGTIARVYVAIYNPFTSMLHLLGAASGQE